MLYLKDKPAKLYRGDCKPMQLYHGDKHITGYEYLSATGEILSVPNTYNDSAWLKINGNTVEVGTGDKSPDNPYILQSVENFDLISTDGTLIQTVNFPYTLRSLPDGVCDKLIMDNRQKRAWMHKFTKKLTLSAGDEWTLSDAKPNSSIRCSHLPNTALDSKTLTAGETVEENHIVIYELAAPDTTEVSYEEIKTYYPYTQIYTTSEVQPALDGKIRVWGA